jgi:hypothetical protein
MAALVAAIHVGKAADRRQQKRSLIRQRFRSVTTWIAGTSPAMTTWFLWDMPALDQTILGQARP